MLPERRKQLVTTYCKAVIRYKLLSKELLNIERFNNNAEYGLYNPDNKTRIKSIMATAYVDVMSKREVVLNTIKDIFSQLTGNLNFGWELPILSIKEVAGTSVALGSPIGDNKEYELSLNSGELIALTKDIF